MASEFKELNNLYTKRPAVALFRKPFANNDEMSDILEGMLDIYASVEQQSISKYKAPKYKAIYWNHLSGKPTFERYGELVLFYADSKFRALTEIFRNNSELEKRLFSELEKFGYISTKDFLSVVPRQQAEGWLQPVDYDTYKKLSEAESVQLRYRKEARTFDLWVVDPRLKVILDNKSITATQGLNVTSTNRPYLDYFEKISKISESKFASSQEGLKVIQDLKASNVKDISFYEITLREDVAWEIKTQKQVTDIVNKFTNDNIDFLFWTKICEQHKDFLKKAYSGFLNNPVEKDWGLSNFIVRNSNIAGGRVNEFKNPYEVSLIIPINASFFGVGSSFEKYILKNNAFYITNNLKNLLYPGSLVFSEFSSQTFPYKTEKGATVKIQYLSDGARKVIQIIGIESLLVSDLIEIYTELCRRSGSVAPVTSSPNKTSNQEDLLIYTFGYDSPLRLSLFSTAGGTKDDRTLQKSTLTENQAELAATVLNLARIRANINTEVVTKTKLKKNLTHGAIPNVLDFKLEYYAKIYERYIKPRYEKYTEFIKSGLMKVYPSDIIDYGNTIQSMVSDIRSINVSTYSDMLDSYRKSLFHTPQEKLDLIEYFESVLFNNYSGFYTTSTTPLSETISPYANTYIDESNISSQYNDQAASMLAAISAFGSKGDIFTEINNVSNKDVSSVAISRQARGKSSASIVIKNINSKYCFSSGKYAGDIIFEPMDEFFIYLPTFDEKLVLSFKGFIDSAQYINDKGYHSIGIQASCPMKKLELVRTNVRPSLSSAENSNAAIHPFTVPKALYESIDRWGPFMFMQALTFYSSMLKQSTIEDANTYIYTVDPNTKLPDFKDTLLQFLWYRQTNAQNTQERAASALIDLTSKYTSTETFVAGQPISSAFMEGSNSLFEMYDKVSSKEGNTNFKVTYNIFAQRSDGYTPINKTLVAQLLGTLQPAWVIGSQDVNIVFSDYRTNLDILTETADKFNCYIYSDKNGVVQFRPPQISLMNLNCTTYDNMGTLDVDRVLKQGDYSYEVRPDMIDSQTTTTYHAQCDDSSLVTWLQLSGQNIWGCLNADNGNAVVIQDIPKSLKYGIKTQQEQILSGIEKKEALYIYGLSLLDRQNSLFRSGNIAGLASGDMDINISMYSPTDNTVYLADGLTINYNAGGSLTYNIPLKWGRKPLFEIPLAKSTTIDTTSIFDPTKRVIYSQINFPKLRELLLKTVKNHEITTAYYYQLISYIDYVEKYPENDYILSSFMFNGYVWDGISSISFEDLILTYFGSLLSQDSGFEIAFGINGRGLTDAQAREVIGKADKKPQRILTIYGGEILNVVIPNGSNREKQISIYADPNRKY